MFRAGFISVIFIIAFSCFSSGLRAADTCYAEGFDTTFVCAGDSVFYDGMYFNDDTLLTDTIVDSLSCDSIHYFEVIIQPTSVSQYFVDICKGESTQIDGTNVTVAGTYPVLYQSALGCDSIVLITVHVEEIDTFLLELRDSTLYAPDGYSLYNWFLNDSLIQSGADSVLETPDYGLFRVEVQSNLGCWGASDSFLYQKEEEPEDTTNTSFGHVLHSHKTYRIYPNPSSNSMVQIQPVDPGIQPKWMVFSMDGKLVSKGQGYFVDAELPNGLYRLSIQGGIDFEILPWAIVSN